VFGDEKGRLRVDDCERLVVDEPDVDPEFSMLVRHGGEDPIAHEQIAAGGTVSDIMFLCESVLVGVVLGCFQLGSDERALDAIVSRVKERLAKVRLEALEMKGKA